VYAKLCNYCELLENCQIKAALRTAMEVASSCNKYFQDNELWVLLDRERGRCATGIFVLVNLLRLLGAMLEPFVPSLSAKLYEQLALQRTMRDESLLAELSVEALLKLVP